MSASMSLCHRLLTINNKEMEKLCLYARNLRPILRETNNKEDEIDLDNVILSHYRLSEIRRQDLKLQEDSPEYKLDPGR